MSITEQGSWDVPGLPEPPRDSVGDDWGDGPAAYEPGERPSRPGDRTPPQDDAAEQSVLGAMLLSKDAIADVVEVLRGPDFYRPAHEIIFDAIIDLYGRGEPADPITVGDELPAARRAGPDRRRAPTSTRCRPASRSRPTPATTPRSSARRRSCAAWSTPAPRSSRWATPARARSTTSSTRRRPRSTRSPSAVPPRTTRRCRDIMDGVLDEIEAIGNREAGL